MPITKRKPGQNKKTYFTPEEVLAFRAWLTIIIGEADLARDKAARMDHTVPEFGAAASVAHWDGWISCLKSLYHRVETGTKWKLFDAAVKLVLDATPPATPGGK